MESLGVQKGKVKVVAYDPEWPNLFALEQTRLANLLNIPQGNIIHFGSTSIKNCNAKPIIDIAIPVDSLSGAKGIVNILCETEYAWNNIYFLCDRVCFSKGSPQTHLLYVIQQESPVFINWITFKRILNNNTSLVEKYNELKVNLSSLYAHDRISYTDHKTDFIYKILNQDDLWQMTMSTLSRT